MAKSTKDRVRKWRDRQKKRGGRSLTCWLDASAARNFKLIKAMTGATTDAIIADALDELYRHSWHTRLAVLLENLRKLQAQPTSKSDLTVVYQQLIAIIAYDTNSPAEIKKALNRLEVPNYNGQTGNWKIDQVRHLMNP
jgi:hypothetical protein